MFSNILISHHTHVVKKMYVVKYNVALVVISDKSRKTFFFCEEIKLVRIQKKKGLSFYYVLIGCKTPFLGVNFCIIYVNHLYYHENNFMITV